VEAVEAAATVAKVAAQLELGVVALAGEGHAKTRLSRAPT
jgi:hypothetical protein